MTNFDQWLGELVPFPARVALWATLSGMLSMGLYALTSPQRRLRELRDRSAALQKTLVQYDGDFSGALVLVRLNLRLSLTRLLYALGPSLAAGVPVVLALLWMFQTYPPIDAALGGWWHSWLVGYLLATTITALGVKFLFRIC